MKKLLAVCLLCGLLLKGCVPGGVQTISMDKSNDPDDATSGLGKPAAEAVHINPFTGLALPSGVAATRPVVVFVDNVQHNRPSQGLSLADIVFETVVWGDISRFAALYSDYKAMPVVGAVREMHMPLLQCVFAAQPVLVSDAVSAPAAAWMEQENYFPYLFDTRYGQTVTWRNTKKMAEGRPTEHCNYTDGGNFAAAVQVYGTDMQADADAALFSFSSTEQDAGDIERIKVPSQSMEIDFSETYATRFFYDAATAQYGMEQKDLDGNYAKSIDGNTGQQLYFDNIVVLFADVEQREQTGQDAFNDVVDIQFAAGGRGFYCQGGRAVSLTWQKNTERTPFQMETEWEPLTLRPGRTYVAVVDKSREAFFSLG